MDIFCILGEKERHRRSNPPADLLAAFEAALVEKYGQSNVTRQRRSVAVDFGLKTDENEETDGKVMSFDVVPAFTKDNHYEIPDIGNPKDWTETDPQVHFDLAVEAHQRYKREWKGLVRMTKKWNTNANKPVKPSFLIEVMALELLVPPFEGDYRYEFKGLLAAMAGRIHDTWPDPAGLGPPVSDSMDRTARDAAQIALRNAESAAAAAIQLERQGKNGESLKAWRTIFGPLFPLS